MEGLLPGLFKLMDERGVLRFVTTGFLWLIIFGISSWMLGLIWGSVIWPLAEALGTLTGVLVEDDASRQFLVRQIFLSAAVLLVFTPLSVGVAWMLTRRARRLAVKAEEWYNQHIQESHSDEPLQ